MLKKCKKEKFDTSGRSLDLPKRIKWNFYSRNVQITETKTVKDEINRIVKAVKNRKWEYRTGEMLRKKA